ncbi:CoA transferase, partial [Thermodesulfobacteriota bacterium]
MPALLEGIRVIEFASRGGGPIGGVVLGDFGADVIKIEHPVGGDPVRGTNRWRSGGIRAVPPGGHSVAFELSNRNKRGITLDLNKEKAREIAYKLIEKADAFLSNYQPYRLKRFGMDYETLSKLNPKLVFAAATSYGKEGPDRDKRSIDPMALARSGMLGTAAADEEGTPPVTINGTIADVTGGTFLGIAVMLGLLGRERHGVGQEINSALFGPMIWAQYSNLTLYYLDGHLQEMKSSKAETSIHYLHCRRHIRTRCG